MGRPAKRKGALLTPYNSGTADCWERGYSRYGYSFEVHPAFTSMDYGPREVYREMVTECGLQNGEVNNRPFTFTRMTADKYKISDSTLRHCVKVLSERGFIDFTSGKNTRTATEYRLSARWREKDEK